MKQKAPLVQTVLVENSTNNSRNIYSNVEIVSRTGNTNAGLKSSNKFIQSWDKDITRKECYKLISLLTLVATILNILANKIK